MKKILIIFTAALMIVGCVKKPVQETPKSEPTTQEPQVEGLFTDITGVTLAGEELSLSDLVGKTDYLLLDFWASWCGPCRRFIPVLKEMYISQPEGHFQILSCSVDQDIRAWKVALDEEQMPWPQIREDADHVCSDKYGVQFIPHTVLIDREGKIIGINLEEPEIEEILLGE